MDYSRKPNKKNPFAEASFLSKFLFLWIIPIFHKGKNGLTADDITENLSKDNASELGDLVERQWDIQYKKYLKNNNKRILLLTLFNTPIFKSIFRHGFYQTISLTFRSITPFILIRLLKVLQMTTTQINKIGDNDYKRELSDNSSMLINGDVGYHQFYIVNGSIEINSYGILSSENVLHYIWNNVYCLECIIIMSLLLGSFIGLHSEFNQRVLGARIRIACSSLIYRKTLRLSKKSMRNITAGYLINLLSNDVMRFDNGFIYLHLIWTLPTQVCLIGYLIWIDIGFAPTFVGIISMLLQSIPLQTGLSRLSANLRTKIAKLTDKRVGTMNEIIHGIQVIKMYAWETPFNAVVAKIRLQEIKVICCALNIVGMYLSSRNFVSRLTVFFIILTMYLIGQDIEVNIVFSLVQYFNCLQLIVVIFFPMAMSMGSEAISAADRIQTFLLMDEIIDNVPLITNVSDDSDELSKVNVAENVIEIKNLTAAWTDECETLKNITINMKKGQLCAIIGPVGAGKSSLLHLLLKELPIMSGNVSIMGTISYAAQEPWLFSGTIQNNILFGEIFDRKRYNQIVNLCALELDFKELQSGDLSMVGENGVILSGGQRARISLARALYKPAEIYLFDDPLSAVDTNVGKYLYENIIGPHGHLTETNATRILVTHQIHFLKKADVMVIIENGRIIRYGSYEQLQQSNLDFAKLLGTSDKMEKEDNEHNCDVQTDEDNICIKENNSEMYAIKRKRSGIFGSMNKSKNCSDSVDDLINNIVDEKQSIEEKQIEEKISEGVISRNLWLKYFLSNGSTCKLITLILIIMTSQIIINGSDYFLKYITLMEYYRLRNIPTTFTTEQSLYMYGSIMIGLVSICYLRMHVFIKVCMSSSNNLHNQMFQHLMNAPMKFFDTNPSGRILNRFSKDMGAVDELLPRIMFDALQIFLILIGIFIVVIIENLIFLIVIIIIIILNAMVLKFYLRPSQDLKHLESICKSPVFSHLSYTLTGISTIRANHLQTKLINEFDNLQNVHSSVYRLVVSSACALGLWLDMLCIIFTSCILFVFVLFYDGGFSGSIGLALTQVFLLTGMVQYGLRQFTETIQHLNSVERILQYGDIELEPNSNKKPDENWPTNGTIKFNNLSLRYDLDKPFVLKNLFIHIESNWKVGVIGRTGAGKSSLINALFRLSPIEGEILIDGLDTSHISLESLRSKISIIPQDPVLFSATIRYNLDPFNLFSDDVLWRSLEDVELKQAVSSLDYLVTEGGSNFSIGQRQLLCLARALLRNNKILVLDEATANCDPQTDILIQQTIRIKFDQCTVITVAHRLHTVMDSDRILVMDNGYAKEFDIPNVLLKNENSLFRKYVDITGTQESEILKRMAFDKYHQITKK